MRRSLSRFSGFTLIELLIVVAVLAILAAIVYPKFFSTTLIAEENAHRAQLEHIRRQITLYRAHHGGALPNLINNWDDLTKKSVYKGRTFGPYLDRIPVNHKRSNVLDGLRVDPPLPHAYVYDYRAGAGTGQIWATNGSGVHLRKW